MTHHATIEDLAALGRATSGGAHSPTGVDDPPTNPASTERGRLAEGLDELQRLRAMEHRLIEWATQLEVNRDKPGDVGKFIAAELRSRMAGARNHRP